MERLLPFYVSCTTALISLSRAIKISYLNDYLDYHTQGLSKEELVENLFAILKDIESDEIPYISKI